MEQAGAGLCKYRMMKPCPIISGVSWRCHAHLALSHQQTTAAIAAETPTLSTGQIRNVVAGLWECGWQLGSFRKPLFPVPTSLSTTDLQWAVDQLTCRTRQPSRRSFPPFDRFLVPFQSSIGLAATAVNEGWGPPVPGPQGPCLFRRPPLESSSPSPTYRLGFPFRVELVDRSLSGQWPPPLTDESVQNAAGLRDCPCTRISLYFVHVDCQRWDYLRLQQQ